MFDRNAVSQGNTNAAGTFKRNRDEHSREDPQAAWGRRGKVEGKKQGLTASGMVGKVY